MKINLNGEDSKIVKKNKTYTLIDNTDLNNLVVSKTILHPEKSTTGHNHKGQEEVYQFVSGYGTMIVGTNVYLVGPGDLVLISDGDFHRVSNTSKDTHTELVKEVVGEAVKLLSLYDRNCKISMNMAMGNCKDFLKENFDLEKK